MKKLAALFAVLFAASFLAGRAAASIMAVGPVPLPVQDLHPIATIENDDGMVILFVEPGPCPAPYRFVGAVTDAGNVTGCWTKTGDFIVVTFDGQDALIVRAAAFEPFDEKATHRSQM